MKKRIQFKNILSGYYRFIKSFGEDLLDDKLGHYASSLSWSTLFSLIPLLVVVLSIFSSLHFFDTVYANAQTLIFENLMPTDSKVVMDYINRYIESTNKLGTLGAVYVLIAVIMFFKNYDFIVNDIFDVQQRPLWKTVRTYLILLAVIPVMMGSSFYLSSVIQSYLDQNSITAIIHIYSFLPYLIVWMMFYLSYQLSANIKIEVSAAMISSFIASLIWYLSKSAFIFYVLHNKTYLSIYGSISTLLFFFLWIYISWVIFIHGLKFCNILNKEDKEDNEDNEDQ